VVLCTKPLTIRDHDPRDLLRVQNWPRTGPEYPLLSSIAVGDIVASQSHRQRNQRRRRPVLGRVPRPGWTVPSRQGQRQKREAGCRPSFHAAAVHSLAVRSWFPSQHSTPTPTPTNGHSHSLPHLSLRTTSDGAGGSTRAKMQQNAACCVSIPSPCPLSPVVPTSTGAALELPVDEPGHLDTVRRTTGSFYLCNPPANHRLALCCHTAHFHLQTSKALLGAVQPPPLPSVCPQCCLTTVMGIPST
jgi:hypothetical protein